MHFELEVAWLWTYLGYYVGFCSLLGLLVMAYDKRLAKTPKRRIPEKTLLLIGAVGGSPGIWLGMYLWHHKTRKPKFYLGVPAIFAVQVATFLFAYTKL